MDYSLSQTFLELPPDYALVIEVPTTVNNPISTNLFDLTDIYTQAINTLEYTTTKTNLDTAELDVVRAKYDYLFHLKLIDLYLGKTF